MEPAKKIKKWLDSLKPGSAVAVDRGGLTIVEIGKNGKSTGSFYEIGGVDYEGGCAGLYPNGTTDNKEDS